MMTNVKERLGDYLVNRQVIRVDQQRAALRAQNDSGLPLGQQLIAMGMLSPDQVQAALSTLLASDVVVALSRWPQQAEALKFLSYQDARRLVIYPLAHDVAVDELIVASYQPNDLLLQDQFRQCLPTHMRVKWVFAVKADIERAIERGYPLAQAGSGLASCLATDGGVDCVALLDELIALAMEQQASDIHFSPHVGNFVISLRVDGVLREVLCLHQSHWSAVSVRIKVLASLNIAENRGIQEGRFRWGRADRETDCRVSIFPVDLGESIVIRLLGGARVIRGLSALGATERAQLKLQEMLLKREGLHLFCGPTGSGKTTTLYTVLSALPHEGLNVMSLEDPVEYRLHGVRQASIGDYLKMDFADGLKAVLRQDPDRLVVGEIRDAETAQIAFKAAMTGHLLFATLHASSVEGAIDRLLDFGLTQQMLRHHVASITVQRLIRQLCPHCQQSAMPNQVFVAFAEHYQLPLPAQIYVAGQCAACHGTGYKGRLPILVSVIQPLLMKGESIASSYASDSYLEMLKEAWQLMVDGRTTADEIARVFSLDVRLV